MTLRRRRPRPPSAPATFDAALRESVFRSTAGRPDLFGSVLARLRAAAGADPDAQARHLGLDLDALVRLSLARLPRPGHVEADLAAAAAYAGVSVDLLAGVLRDAEALPEADAEADPGPQP